MWPLRAARLALWVATEPVVRAGVALSEGSWAPMVHSATCRLAKAARSIGRASFRMGGASCSLGRAAFPFGRASFSFGVASFSLRHASVSIGTAAFVIDSSSRSVGSASFCIGRASFSLGRAAFPFGRASSSLGEDAFPIGEDAFPIGRASFLVGEASLLVEGAALSRGDAGPAAGKKALEAELRRSTLVNREGRDSVAREVVKFLSVAWASLESRRSLPLRESLVPATLPSVHSPTARRPSSIRARRDRVGPPG